MIEELFEALFEAISSERALVMRRLRKEMEKGLVRTAYTSFKQFEFFTFKGKMKSKVHTIAQENQEIVNLIMNHLDESIKGRKSVAIRHKVENINQHLKEL